MRKKFSHSAQKEAAVSSGEYVLRASQWARTLEDREAVRSGKLEVARGVISRRHDIPENILSSLRYRPPKSIPVHIYEKIRAALIAANKREAALLIHEATRALEFGMHVSAGDIRAVEAAISALDAFSPEAETQAEAEAKE